MFIKANKTKKGGKDYTNYLLVESLHTERGPRHKVIASLGNLKPAPAEYWYQLAKKVESALAGQLSLLDDSEVKRIVDKVGNRKPTQDEKTAQTADSDRAEQIDVDGVRVEEAREGGPAHVGHQMWLKLGMNEILDKLDFNERERSLTELLVLSRLITPGSELATRDWVPRTALPDI
jgi:hypothetical protein